MTRDYRRVELIQGSPAWTAWRTTIIGASDAAAIMGQNPWKSREELLREKLSGVSAFQGNTATRRGQALEPIARRIYEGHQGIAVEPAVLVSAARPWQAASVDGISPTGERVVEIKCGQKAHAILRDSGIVPSYYFGQLQHILSVTGLASIDYFSYQPDAPFLLRKVAREERYIEALLAAETRFWEAVQRGREESGRSSVRVSGSRVDPPSDGLVQKISYPDGRVYQGYVRNGIPFGRGSLCLPSGTEYEGEFVEGNWHGRGVLTWSSGDRYEGDFVKDKRTGRGVYTWADGRRYEGDFVEDKRTGRGIFTWPSGGRYEGDFIEDKLTGRGVHTWPNGDRYEGDFVEAKLTGRGVHTWADGRRYEGDFVEAKLTGRGVYTWADGRRYEGDFVEDKPTGRGIFTWPSGDRYEGDFVEAKLTGRGVYTWADGDRYEGDFVEAKLTGRGIFTWSNGDRHEGDWAEGTRHGPGVLIWASGDRSEGRSAGDQERGPGTLSSSRGWVLKGIWSEGDVVEGELTFENGDRYVGGFLEGQADGDGKLALVSGLQFAGNWDCGVPCDDGEVSGAYSLDDSGVAVGLRNAVSAVDDMRRQMREWSTPRWRGLLLQVKSFGMDQIGAAAKYRERAEFIRAFDRVLCKLEDAIEEEEATEFGDSHTGVILLPGTRSNDLDQDLGECTEDISADGRRRLIEAIAYKISVKKKSARLLADGLVEVREATEDFRMHCMMSPWRYLGEED